MAQRRQCYIFVLVAAAVAAWSICRSRAQSYISSLTPPVALWSRRVKSSRPWLCSSSSSFHPAILESNRVRRPKSFRGAGKKDVMDDFEALRDMAQDLEKMQADPRPRGGRRVGAAVWYDVSLKLPLGVGIDEVDTGDAKVGISEVREGGSVYQHNEDVTLVQDKQKRVNFVMPGDRIIQINGQTIKTQADVVELITSTPEGGEVNLKFARNTVGPIKVFFPPPAIPVVVGAKSKLSDVAFSAGHAVTYDDACGKGEDGERCDGSCWHFNNATGDIYQLCDPNCLACEIPGDNADKQFAGLAAAVANIDVGLTTWPNTEPLVLTPCPELAKRMRDPYLGRWKYWNGKYKVTRTPEGERLFEEGRVQGILRDEGEYAVADLTNPLDDTPQGSIRLKPGENKGFTTDMVSQYRAEGSEEWQEAVTAFDLGAL